MLRVGFVGTGFIATFHSKMLRRCGVDHERSGVFDLDRARAEAFAQASGGTAVDSVAEVLAGSDAVFVCTWTSAHEEVVRDAVRAGVAVFVEKPLGPDLAAAERITARLATSGLVHQVGLVLRRSPAFALAESILEDRDLTGRVMTAVFRDDQVLPTGGRYASDWRGDVDRAGGGVLLEHSIHDVDLLDRLLGPVAAVRAVQRNFHGLVGIEDLVVAGFDLPDGGVASLTTVWHDVEPRNSLRLLEIHAERAFISVEEDWFGPVTLTHGTTTTTWAGDDLLAECERRGLDLPIPEAHFLRAVEAGTPSHPDAAVALRAHVLVDALYRSAADDGRTIAL